MPTTLEQLQYGFDRDSRRTWQKRPLSTTQDQSYQYDALSQVNAAALGSLNLNATAISGIPSLDESWDYDPTGNWRGYHAAANGSSTLDQHRVHDRGNRLTQLEDTPHNMILDRVGRMRQMAPDASGDWDGKLELTWDAWSRITSVKNNGTEVGSYGYDGRHRRITREVDGEALHSYYNVEWRPVEERKDAEATASISYLWGSRHRDDLVRRDRAVGSMTLNETRYILMDYFNPAAITDEEGAVTERYAFSVFGLRTTLNPAFTVRSDSESGMEFSFQGQFLDGESSLMNYGHRYYSPYSGRWTCKDPIEERGGVNLMAFCSNTPVNGVDHLGLIDWLGPNSNNVKAHMENTQVGRDQIQRITDNDTKNGTNTVVRDQHRFRDDPETKGGYNPQTQEIVVPDNPWQYESNRGPTPSTQAQVTVHELDHREQDQNKKLEELRKQKDEKCGTKAEKSAIDAENEYNRQDKSGPKRPDRLNHNVVRPQ